MKRITTISAAFVLAALPVMADEANPDLKDGADLLSEGTKLILRGLLSELEPAAEGWENLVDMMRDMTLYHPPEILPNGDIIIRRKTPLDPEVGEDGEVDL